jgi:hypothetical protein
MKKLLLAVVLTLANNIQADSSDPTVSRWEAERAKMRAEDNFKEQQRLESIAVSPGLPYNFPVYNAPKPSIDDAYYKARRAADCAYGGRC